MTKLIIITLLSTLSLLATMQMQTIQTKKIVVGTFKTVDTLNSAKQTLANNGVLQRIQQQNNFVMTTRTNAGATTLILEKFKTMRMALNAFVAVSKHYPKAYLIDDSYTVAMEVPQTPPKPTQYEPPVTTLESTPIPVTPTITEAVVTAVATSEIEQTPVPETLPQPVESEPNITEKNDEPIIVVVTEAGSEAERRAIEKALEKNNIQQQAPQEEEEEVVITEIEEIPLDETHTAITSSVLEETAATTNSTIVTSTTLDEERYKRKPQQEEPFLSSSTLIYILIAVIIILLLLLWRRSRDVDVHKILGEQHQH